MKSRPDTFNLVSFLDGPSPSNNPELRHLILGETIAHCEAWLNLIEDRSETLDMVPSMRHAVLKMGMLQNEIGTLVGLCLALRIVKLGQLPDLLILELKESLNGIRQLWSQTETALGEPL